MKEEARHARDIAAVATVAEEAEKLAVATAAPPPTDLAEALALASRPYLNGSVWSDAEWLMSPPTCSSVPEAE